MVINYSYIKKKFFSLLVILFIPQEILDDFLQKL